MIKLTYLAAVLLPVLPAGALTIDFDDGNNPFSTGVVSTNYSVSGSNSLYLGNREYANFALPSEYSGKSVVITMKVLDLGLWIDTSVTNAPGTAYGPRWGVGKSVEAANYVAATIIHKGFLPATAGYGYHPVSAGDAFNGVNWFSPAFISGSTRAVLSEDGGSWDGAAWVPGTVAAQPVWTEWVFTVGSNGDLSMQMTGGGAVTGNNIGGAATAVLLYGGNNNSSPNALTGLYVDDITIQLDASADLEAPSVPTGLAADAILDNSISISWEASTDNVAVEGYHVSVDGGDPIETAGTSLELTNLLGGKEYSITVSAFDASGNESDPSDPLVVTTTTLNTLRYGFEILEGGAIDTGNFLGYLEIGNNEWVYSTELNSYFWINDPFGMDLSRAEGTWAYVAGMSHSIYGSGDLAYGYPKLGEWIFTHDFLGILNVERAPWVFLADVGSWAYTMAGPEENLSGKQRGWVRFYNSDYRYQQAVLADNPVAYWRFQEQTGELATDEIHGLEAVLTNGADLMTNGQGSAIGFNANEEQMASVADNPVLDLSGSFSLEFWVYTPFRQPIFTALLGKGGDAFEMVWSSGGIRFTVLGGEGGTGLLLGSTKPAELEWTHVVAVYDMEAGQMRLYFNGQQDSNTAARTGSFGSNDEALFIGTNANGSGYRPYFTGLMDEVAVYDHALTSDRILAHYQAARVDPAGMVPEAFEVTVSDILSQTASVSWITNIPSTARIYYGLDAENLDQSTELVDAGAMQHEASLTGLQPDSDYFFVVECVDAKGRVSLSEVYTFTTVPMVELQEVQATQVTSGSAVIRWGTNNEADAIVNWGTASDQLTQSTELATEDGSFHNLNIYGLEPNTTYYYTVTSTDIYGDTRTSDVMSFTTLGPDDVFMTSELSQWGITWYFDKPYEAGQFVNGDWWVLGPVQVVAVSPEPGVAPADEINDFGPNHWGDLGLQDNSSMRNGSMVVLSPSNTTAFDSRGLNYKASAALSFPYNLDANRSLLSSRSYKTMPHLRMFHHIMWDSEKTGVNPIRTVAVLTCLSEKPPADAFRPSYIGTTKDIYQAGNLQWDKLLNLTVDSSLVPSFARYERYTQRVWVDHMNGSWVGQHLLPNENQASYGREIVRIVGQASMMLHLDVPQETKRKLLINLVQKGIDLEAMVALGGNYNEGGGHTSGRKWPIIFAGLMLGEQGFLDTAAGGIFHEDTQTYYGNGWAGQTALWQMIVHHGVRKTYMHLTPDQWGTYDDGWAQTSEGYRVCCNAKAWVGQTLAALLMGAKADWNHNAYFDYMEDWMRQEDIYAANRGGFARPSQETTAFESFVEAMWLIYRDDVPAQADGDTDRMWIPNGGGSNGTWVDNPKPE